MSEGAPKLRYDPEKFLAYKERLQGYLEALSEEEYAVAEAKIIRKKEDLKKEYSEDTLMFCAMYHALIGSGIDEKIHRIYKEDFAGKDSVVDFIDNLVSQG